MTDPPTVLVTVTGADRPGVTAAMLDACAAPGAVLLDVAQVLVSGRLVLSVLLSAPSDEDALRARVLAAAARLGLDVEVRPGRSDHLRARPDRLHVTVLGAELRPAAVGAIAERIAESGANIERIVSMAARPLTALQLDVSGGPSQSLRRALAVEAARQGVDVAVQPAGLHRHAHRLVVLDVDSTLVQGEVIELVAQRVGCGGEMAARTAAAMAGEVDFAESLRERVKLLAGTPVAVLDDVYESLRYTPGATTLVRALRRLGYRFALVSGGFRQITDRIAADLVIDFVAANRLEIRDGRLTGRLEGPVLDRVGKAAALRRFAAAAGIPILHTIAIGDGANDIDMLATAGLGIAFNAKPVLKDAADAALSVPNLDAILYLLGISREEVEAADATEG